MSVNCKPVGFPDFPDDRVPYGYIYRITNTHSGKTYIGQRMLKYDRTWNTYWGSGVRLRRVMDKWGRDFFTKELLAYAYSRAEIDALELAFTVNEKENGKAQYNIIIGTTFAGADPAVFKKAAATARRNNKIRFDAIFSELGEEIVAFYRRAKHVGKTSKEFGIPRNRINTFLKEQGVQLNSQTETGATRTPEQSRRISLGMIAKNLLDDGMCERCSETVKNSTEVLVLANFCDENCYRLYRDSSVLHICVACGEESYERFHNNRNICSVECRESHNRERQKANAEARTVRKAKKIDICSAACRKIYNEESQRVKASVRPTPQIKDETLLLAKRLYEVENMSIRKISEQLGIERKFLSRKLQASGVSTSRFYSERLLAEAVRMHGEGVSVAKIAKHFKVSPDTLGKKLKELGIDISGVYNVSLDERFTDDVMREAVRLYTVERMSLRKISEVLNVPRSPLSVRLREAGVAVRAGNTKP